MVLVEVAGETVILQKPLDIATGHHQPKVIWPKGAFDQLYVLLQVGHLGLHSLGLFARYACRWLLCSRFYQVSGVRCCKDRLDIGHSVVVGRDHQFRRLNLPQGLHLAQGAEAVDRTMPGLQQFGRFGADAVQQGPLLPDQRNVHIQGCRDASLRYAALDRAQDHLVLLDRSEAADALVVGEGLVIGGHQAGDGRLAHFLQNMQPNMAIQNDEGSVLPSRAGDHRRFDQPDLADRRGDLPIFLALWHSDWQLLDRQDRINRDRAQVRLESRALRRRHFSCLCHALGSRNPSMMMRGKLSRPSARSSVRKFSSFSRD